MTITFRSVVSLGFVQIAKFACLDICQPYILSDGDSRFCPSLRWSGDRILLNGAKNKEISIPNTRSQEFDTQSSAHLDPGARPEPRIGCLDP